MKMTELLTEFGVGHGDYPRIVRLARSFNRMSLKWRKHYPERANKLRNEARDLIDFVRFHRAAIKRQAVSKVEAFMSAHQ